METANVAKAQQEQQVQDGGDFGATKEETAPTPAPEPKKEKPKPKKTSAPKSEEVDIEKELEKLKGLLDKGLITQEAYDAKMNQLLGL